MPATGDEQDSEIQTLLSQWQQGDFTLDCNTLIFADSPDDGDAEPFSTMYEEGISGFVVISQTCDIVRDTHTLPRVSVCPLIEVDQSTISMIVSGKVSKFGIVENTPRGLVADFSKVMSVTKKLLTTWDRRSGFTTAKNAIRFARGLERHLGRFAFPDEFNRSIHTLRDSIFKKYGKPNSEHGSIFRELEEIRVRADPSWQGSEILLQFYIIVDSISCSDDLIERASEVFQEILNKLPWEKPFALGAPSVLIGTYEDFTALDYTESVPLDLNSISFAEKFAT